MVSQLWKKGGFNPKLVAQEYDTLVSLYHQEPVISQLSQKPPYFARNRYSDILTYDKTRVILKKGADVSQRVESDYINACYVNSPFPDHSTPGIEGDRKIIASQGPLPETTEHFWQMIVENNVTLIVSTCRLQESGRAKCNKFWPNKGNGGLNILQANISQDPSQPEYVQVSLLDEL